MRGELDVPPSEMRLLRDKRNDLVHSRVTVEDLTDGLDEAIRVGYHVAHHAFLALLGHSSEERANVIRGYLFPSTPPRLVVLAPLHGWTRNDLMGRDKYPQLKLDGVTTVKLPKTGGADFEKGPIALKLHLRRENAACDWRVEEVAWWTGIGSGVPIEGMEFLVDQV